MVASFPERAVTMQENPIAGKVVLITGGARRVGAVVCRHLHAHGMNLVLHYRSSRDEAEQLQNELNNQRPDSVTLLQGDLLHTDTLNTLARQAADAFGRLDVLINNASSFYPTPIGQAGEKEWDDLMGTNLKVPFFLSQAAAPYLKQTGGTIVSIADIHAERPLKNHTIYSMAKAGLVMMTRSLARELAPEVRVNAIAPGAILWPENPLEDAAKEEIIARTPLKRTGQPQDIANTVLFLIRDAHYITGQVIAVCGGRSITL
jgi:pteridine reductase